MSKPDLKTKTRLAMGELLDRVLGSVTPRHPATPSRALDLSELEERILLSASPIMAVAEMAEPAPVESMAEESAVMTTDAAPLSETESSASQQSSSNISTNPSQSPSHELVFLDTSVEDYQQLLNDLWSNDDPSREIEVVLLSSSRDGVNQISEALAGRSDVDAVHIVSHGTDRGVQLGSTWLTSESLGGYVGEISRWGHSLSSSADLLFYGCDLASCADGQKLLESVQLLTGADVASSIDDTGAAVLGGDWDFEYELGHVESVSAFSLTAQAEWFGVLDAATTVTDVTSNAATASEAALTELAESTNEEEIEFLSPPLAFDENLGQTDDAVNFLAHGSGYTVFLSGGDAVLGVSDGDTAYTVRLHLEGGDSAASVVGQNELVSRSNYLISDSSEWQTDVASLDTVRYSDVYEGIDVAYYGNQRQLEYDFIVEAGADAGLIQLNFNGVEGLYVDGNGELAILLSVDGDEIHFRAPYSYQETEAGRQTVVSRYRINADGTVGFDLGDYDASRELVIAPILNYEEYLGSSVADAGENPALAEISDDASAGSASVEPTRLNVEVTAVPQAYAISATEPSSFVATTDQLQIVSHEVVFLDTSVDDYQQLLDDLWTNADPARKFEVMLLDSARDGIVQISEALAGRTGIDAVHVVSHGTDTAMKLGSTWLTADNLSGYAGEIAGWSNALTTDADLLFYGCDLAASEDGQLLVDSISTLTGADVAASNDDTGHAIFGADWDLEYTTGQIETQVAFSQNAQENWGHLLNVAVDNTSTGTSSGGNFSISHTTSGTDRLLLVGVSLNIGTGDSVTSITYDGSSLTPVGTRTDGDAVVEIWSLVNPSLGTHNVDIVVNATTDGVTAGVMTFTGVDQTTPLGTFAADSGTAGAGSVTVSSAANELVFGVISIDDSTDYDIAPDGSQTEDWDLIGGPDINGGGSTKAGAASVNLSWTWSGSDRWAAAGVSIKPVASTGTALWRESGTATPEYSEWNGVTFGTEASAANVGEWRTIQGAESPTRDEKIVLGVDTGGTIEGQIWDGTSWSSIPLTFGSNSQTFWWSADVRYESQSGDAVLTWTDGSNLEYATWDGSSWSSVSTIGAYTGATPRQLQLAASPDSDAMVLVVSDSSSSDYSLVWDGSSWGNAITLSTVSGDDRTDVYVAYEQQSGDALVVYGENSTTAKYRVWNGATWGSEGSISPPAGVTGDVRWTTLASDPGSDRIALGVSTYGSEIWFGVWDGSSWGSQQLAGTSSSTIALTVAVAFESTSGDLLATYSESANQVRYRTWTSGSGWTSELTGPNISSTPNSMTLSSDPLGNNVMLSVQDGNSDVHFVMWDGSSWGTGNELETNSGETKNQPFLFLWDVGTNGDGSGTPPTATLWVSTLFDVTGGGSPGIDTWEDGDVIEFGDPNLALGTATDGTFSSILVLDDFATSDTDIDAIHYVTSDITVGSTISIDLLAGDVLLSTIADETIGGTSFREEDVFVFRPDAFGDYSSGTFFMLIDGSDIGVATDVKSVTLIEQDTLVAGTTYNAGTFLLTAETADILHYDLTSVGTTTAGTNSTFLDLSDIDINDNSVDGLDLVERDIVIGGVSLTSGQLLLTSNDDADAGNNALVKTDYDVFILDITSTGTTSAATATMFFDGSDVMLDSSQEELRAFSLVIEPNVAPTVTMPGGAVNYTENDPATIIDSGATVTDPDSIDFDTGTLTSYFLAGGTASDRLAINNEGTGVGQIGVSGSNVTYNFGAGAITIGTFTGGISGSDPLVVTFTANSNASSAQALMRNLTYENVSDDPDTTPRAVCVVLTDGDGGSDAVKKALNVTAVNDAPVINSDGGGPTAAINVAENSTAVTTVTSTDVDGGTPSYSISGGADAAKFSINNSTGVLTFALAPDFETPTDIGTNNVYDVTVQVSDGTLTDTQAISVTVTDAAPQLADNFDDGAGGSTEYSGNDGTQNWSGDWVESDSGGPTGGDIRVTGTHELQIVTESNGRSIYRQGDLTAASFATLTFDSSNTLFGSGRIKVEVSGNGGGTWTTLKEYTSSNTGSVSESFDITAFAAADTQIRFIVTAEEGSAAIAFDNIEIEHDGSSSNTSPTITSNGGGGTASINVAENTAAVTTVTATDSDLPAQILSYSISGGVDAAKFAINSTTGDLTFSTAPDFEAPTDADTDNVYEVTISVTDGVGGLDTQAIAVTVDNVNEFNPVASNDSYSLDEDTTLTVDWWDSDWTRRQELTFDNSGQTENLSDFAVLVKLNSGNIDYAQTQNSGQDLRFLDADGTALAHEIEEWNEAGDSFVWVSVPQIDGSSSTDSILMYYGNASAADGQNASAVWNSNYVMVQHLEESGTGTRTDSTSFGNDGTTFGYDGNEAVAGFIGGADDLEIGGAVEYIRVSDSASLDISGTEITMSAWIAADFTETTGPASTIMDKRGDSGGTDAYRSTFIASEDDYRFRLSHGASTTNLDTTGITFNADEWHYVVATYDGSNTRMYWDGVEESSVAATGNITTNNEDLLIGVVGNLQNIWDGTLDELRLSDTARSADWIAAQYLTQTDAFITFGVAETAPATSGVVANDSDPDGDPINAILVSGPSNAASFAFNADGTFTYTPTTDFAGADNFTYKVNDGTADSNVATVNLTITAVNDNTPVISSNGGGATAALNVAENSTAVTTVTATDADLPAQTLTYSISGGADAARFSINSSSGALTFASAPDYETPTDVGTNNIYAVVVEVSDGTLTDTQVIAVTVTAVNDNAPVITSDGSGASAAVNVAENATSVTTVVATDADLPAQTLTYSISGGADAAKFSINSSTGALTFATAPDFEAPTDSDTDNVYDVTVQASDGLGGTDTQSIAVTVTAVNDNAPVITSNGGGASAALNVAENSTAVTTVVATDADLPAQTLTYSISGGADSAKFSINSSSGALTFVSAPDYETPTDVGTNNIYAVVVEVSDGTLTDTQVIAVTVTAVNDNAPVITSDGGGASAAVNVAENSTAVTTIVATDADLPAQTLTYSISGGADSTKFAINSSTGDLTFAVAPDFETPTDVGTDNVYEVTVEVSDGAGGTDSQDISVSVIDDTTGDVLLATQDTYVTRDNPTLNYGQSTSLVLNRAGGSIGDERILLQFDVGDIPANATIISASLIMESTQNGGALNINVYEVTQAWDEGSGNGTGDAANWAERQSGVNWSTAGGDYDNNVVATLNTGSIGQHTWDLTSLVADWYSGDSSNFGVLIGSPSIGITTVTYDSSEGISVPQLLVTVDVSNVAPVITSDGGAGAATVNIAENTTPVTTVMATDSDLPAQTLSYSITGVDAARFSIGSSNGVLEFQVAPDRETPTDVGLDNVYDVTVVVSDSVGGVDRQDIAVTVDNVNEAPTITTIADQTPLEDTATGAIAFTIGDVETAAGSLTVTATSNDQTLVPDANITLGGSGASRTIDVLPGLNQTGGPATITVDDGTTTTQTTFDVTVTPDNDAPTITGIADQTPTEDTATGAIAFTVGDVETAAGSLIVTATIRRWFRMRISRWAVRERVAQSTCSPA